MHWSMTGVRGRPADVGQSFTVMCVRQTPLEPSFFDKAIRLALQGEQRGKEVNQPGEVTRRKRGVNTRATAELWSSIPLPGAQAEAACTRA
jgi:hypothetical protein